ncbi:MAG: MFS transporter [Ostreibacterium sp.]
MTMTKTELKTAMLLAGIYASRMLGLFLIFPTFSLLAQGLDNETPFKIGLALGIYSLAQAALQIPAGILSDVIGRKKVLFAGLVLFLIGSVLAALSNNINVIIVARLLQGSGAVSAVCLAYVADSIRGSEHGKAMAIIGMSIAISFIVSFVIGSMISSLSGLFILMAFLALLALVFAYALPAPSQKLTVFKVADFIKVAKNTRLLQVNFQVAFLHLSLSSSFFLIPILLKKHFPDTGHLLLYVPGIVVAFILVMPLIKRSRDKVAARLPLFWMGMALALFLFALVPTFSSVWGFIAVLALFFFAFTFIEAMLPTRLFQLATDISRGASSGIFSVYQYIEKYLSD